MTLPVEEFLRRFLLHLLPRGFVKPLVQWVCSALYDAERMEVLTVPDKCHEIAKP
jgi:hypothetical protein